MTFENEIKFVEQLLKNLRLNISYITKDVIEHYDSYDSIFLNNGEALNKANADNLRLQNILNYKFEHIELFNLLDKNCKPNTIYTMKNILICQFILLRLPIKNYTIFAYIGPYVLEPIQKTDILSLAKNFNVTSGNLTKLQDFYNSIPLIHDENYILNIIYTLGACMWNGYDNFNVVDNIDFLSSFPIIKASLSEEATSNDNFISAQLLEKRYEIENNLIQAVASGKLHKAEMFFSNLSSHQLEKRNENLIRDQKNYAIILNTLLRKAAERATVHPLQLHHISTEYAHRIELIRSYSSFISLAKEMVRKYTLLVKNHSLKNYSMLIRKVIIAINNDLTEDLSLKTQAKALNVNPSYLSTLFRKETGKTLTDFVKQKRIEHALFLLNTTDMQIQIIAMYCGIPDVNYFTKTFKKIVGHTPKEYRDKLTTPK